MTTSNSDKARQVKLLIVDIDGVLTDGGLHFDNRGEEYKTFNSLDGHGIRMLLDCGIEVAVITGRQSGIVDHRMGELGVKHIYQGFRDKLKAVEKLIQDSGCDPEHIAYIGDDLSDLPIMRRVGFAIAVQGDTPFDRTGQGVASGTIEDNARGTSACQILARGIDYGIGEPAGRAHDRDRTVAHSDHLP